MIVKKGKIKIDFLNLNREMEGILNRILRKSSLLETGEAKEWQPYLDIYETEDLFYIVIELAGIVKEEVEISCEEKMLRIAGRRRESLPSIPKKPHHIEIDYGSFERVLSLPDTVDSEGAKASYENGMLVVQFPKRSPVKPEPVRVVVD
jgi:HSP20 family protein